ncbi:uncharacterized protein LOC128016716 isoform X1 [Carassius gibelio]|uniref:uncharacterized protein LOC127986586 isoform X1 n=1 Tax=Carassius gibelio TaxID=101364 RepID=UPI00227778AD|nr:uncharacterized protein LOC127986586 isoform X1 [Carassius gibelio]XP_052448441.1 uncharacterized protein LOC128002906 isoform X1 [Carassius gibelio]XP_052457380.1 uncharacterized protein LOC128016716 isoform X1 [Carassius gibelio]
MFKNCCHFFNSACNRQKTKEEEEFFVNSFSSRLTQSLRMRNVKWTQVFGIETTTTNFRCVAAQLVAYLAKTCKPNFQELDRFTQRFIHIFKAKGGDIGCKLKKILQQIENEKSEIIGRRTAVLHGLPLLLRADPTDFYKTCFDCDDKGEMSGISIGILFVIPEDSATVPYCLHLDATFTAIILEGRVVMDDLGNLPKAMCLLFWLIYALNVEYPAVLKNMFDFFQSVIVTRGKSLKPEKSPVAVTLLCHD